MSGYPFQFYDGGRSTSKRPRQKNDCTVRALSIARDIPYDEAYETLKAAGRECSKGFDFVRWIARQPFATKISFPAKKGEPRMDLFNFCDIHLEGTYILRVAGHVVACVNSVVYDTVKLRENRCVYTAWRIE